MKNLLIPALLLAATPTLAQQAAKGLDGKQPVEINADQLEVRQQENVAVFTGNVIAVQGTTRLKSDVMTVYYTKKEGEPEPAPAPEPVDPAAAATPPANDPMQGAVERIDVEGNVLIITPTETASGKRGVYEVAKKQVTLYEDVTLTRGKNILKGDTLVYDFTTEKSVVNSPKHTPAGQKGTGRVRALFMPEDKKQ